MTKRYVIEKITDIFEIPENRFDDFLVDFQSYYQQGKAWPELLESIANVAGIEAKAYPQHMVWIDDGKHTITVKIGTEGLLDNQAKPDVLAGQSGKGSDET